MINILRRTAATVICLWIVVVAQAANVDLVFNGTTTSGFSYLISVSEDITYTTDAGTSGTITAGTGRRLWVPDKVTSVAYSFSNPSAVIGLDLSWTTDGNYNSKLTEISLSGLVNLKELSLDLNLLTWPVGGQLPENCKVNYGRQNSVSFDVDYGNKINLGRYNTDGWTAKWIFTDIAQEVPSNYYTILNDGTYQFLLNLSSGITLQLSHTSGLTLNSQPLHFNKYLFPVLALATDGRGTATGIGISSNQPIKENFIVGYDGTYIENDTYSLVIDFPSLKNTSRELTLEANIPEVITTLNLNNLGIRKLTLSDYLTNLDNISLKGNSLLPSALPSGLKDFSNVELGTQNTFNLPFSQNAFSFDLSNEINAGAAVVWLDETGQPVDESKYTEREGIYTFTESSGEVKVRLTMDAFPDYEIFSAPVDINFSYEPVAQLSWADNSSFPSMFTIAVSEDMLVLVGEKEYRIEKGVPSDFRLGANSGTITVYSTDNSNITSLDFGNIGIYDLKLGSNLSSLAKLNLNGNSFTPFHLPVGIPEQCEVEWGEMPLIELGNYLSGENGVDLIEFKDFNVEWRYSSSDEAVPENLFSVRAGFYLFENVGEVYALLTNSSYPGLVFRTTVIDFAGTFYPVLEFSCVGLPEKTCTIILDGECRFEINGVNGKDYLSGTTAINFNDENVVNNSNSVYSLKTNFPERILSIDMSDMGIRAISISSDLTGLTDVDLTGNALHFKTFPRNSEYRFIFENQRPVQLEMDSDGTIYFPDFTECRDIRVINGDGTEVPETDYEIDDSRGKLKLNTSVTDAFVVFTDHPEFPGVKISSAPISFISSIINEVSANEADYTLNGKTIRINNVNTVIRLYYPSGILFKTLKGIGSYELPAGYYLLVVQGHSARKIKLQ